MIQRILLSALLVTAFAFTAQAQCVPDVSITVPGIYPDSATGLPAGTVGVAYSEVIQVMVLTDTVFLGQSVTIDNITIDQVSGLPPGITYTCTPANCVFPGGSNGCIQLSGTPTSAGSFPMTVDLLIDATMLGNPIQLPQTVDYYVIDINTAIGIAPVNGASFGVVNLHPNPAGEYTDLTYSTPISGDFRISIYDLIGKQVSQQVVRGFFGNNTIRIKTSQFAPGVYLLNLSNGSSVVSRKVVVSKR